MTMAVVWQCVNWRAKMYGHLPHKLMENVTMFGRTLSRSLESLAVSYPSLLAKPDLDCGRRTTV
jgi:hypothetical protein